MLTQEINQTNRPSTLVPTYAARGLEQEVPKYELPQQSMLPATAYQIIHDELRLDGYSMLNLATFVTTWMDDEADKLLANALDKNMVDRDEYPQTAEIEQRCIKMVAELWNAPDHENAVGTSTIGSSEACMLGGMGMKWRWRNRRKAEGKSIEKPNLIMGANVQVCWHKFCRYWDVEPREVTAEGDRFTLGPEEAVKLIDENTIGVVGIMGSTFDGRYEPIEKLSDALDAYEKKTGLDIPIHVDGASGGFVAPFIQPEIKWDFRLPRVKSINASGHKYGLVYPGVGWVIFREPADLPEDLVFHVKYLGGDMLDLSINFSRPGNRIIGQYYNFLRLGREGYRKVHQASQDVAKSLSSRIGALKPFDLITDGSDIPVFCWQMNEDYAKTASYTLYDVAQKLRERGWLVPAYPMPKNRSDLVVQRIVVKEDFSLDMADNLLIDLKRVIEYFEDRPKNAPTTEGEGFHH
ncbi:MAG: glutamate decarboxylase [Planctomycetes bacterium TMED75]|nr:glutamate decarboxylase [Planctomycetaceae bacterium]OUU94204.1 MAG: glutamate decarboxylase [Planctomycetes bacterium TMED75]